MTYTMKTNEIVVNERKISHSKEDINNMVESIRDNGMLNPLLVTEDNVLVSGLCRLRANVILNNELVECKIVSGTEDELRMMEIDENLVRKTLTQFQIEKLLFEKTQIMKSMKIKNTTGIISEENGISQRKLQKDNKDMKVITSNPILLEILEEMDTEDNLTNDEIRNISESEDIQNDIVNGNVKTTKEVRERIVKKKGLSFKEFDLEEIKSFFNDKVEEMNKLSKDEDREKLTTILTQINSYYSKKLIDTTK